MRNNSRSHSPPTYPPRQRIHKSSLQSSLSPKAHSHTPRVALLASNRLYSSGTLSVADASLLTRHRIIPRMAALSPHTLFSQIADGAGAPRAPPAESKILLRASITPPFRPLSRAISTHQPTHTQRKTALKAPGGGHLFTHSSHITHTKRTHLSKNCFHLLRPSLAGR